MKKVVATIVLLFLASRLPASELSSLKKHYLPARQLLESGQYAKASEKFSKLKDDETSIQDYVLYGYAKSLWSERKCDESKAVFAQLSKKYPDSRWYSLANYIASSSEECPALELPKVEPEKFDCEDQIGDAPQADCYFKSRQYSKAKEIYKRLTAHPGKPKSPAGIQNLIKLSQSAARSQDFKTAIEANRLLMLRYPKSLPGKEALEKIAFLYRDAGQYTDALPVLKQLLKTTKSTQEQRLIWEKIGWCQYRLGKYAEAVRSFESGLEKAETPFLLYWKSRALEKLSSKPEKPDVGYNLLIQDYPSSYYAVRAIERLQHSGKSGFSSIIESWWIPQGMHWSEEEKNLPAFSDLDKIHMLSSLGLNDDAHVEVRRARQNDRWRGGDGVALPNDLASFLKNDQGYRFHVRTVNQDSDYRMPYADFLFSELKRHNNFIDPFLMYAMMRQESRYRESIVSPVGAIGLLQIMPYTGKKLAKEAGWEVYYPSWLRDPLTNIELSIHYMKKLDTLFSGKWYPMVASYNAGEQVVTQWLKQRQGLTEEEFIEEIPYEETRDYVKKIYTYWKAYETIYK